MDIVIDRQMEAKAYSLAGRRDVHLIDRAIEFAVKLMLALFERAAPDGTLVLEGADKKPVTFSLTNSNNKFEFLTIKNGRIKLDMHLAQADLFSLPPRRQTVNPDLASDIHLLSFSLGESDPSFVARRALETAHAAFLTSGQMGRIVKLKPYTFENGPPWLEDLKFINDNCALRIITTEHARADPALVVDVKVKTIKPRRRSKAARARRTPQIRLGRRFD